MADSLTDLGTLGQLLRLVTHDLRNPLAVIISNLGYLGNVVGQSSEDVRETIADTLTSSEDLKHIIENLDLLGQTLAGGSPSSPRPMAVVSATRDVVVRCEPFARSHGVKLSFLLPPGSDTVRVDAPPELFERALANLLRNSIAHSPSGAEVNVGVEVESAHCDIIVRDRGTSFDATNPARTFDAEGQVAAKTELAGRYSRGLGLLVARLAAEGCGAKIAAGSSPEPFRNALSLRFKRS
jgi:signal transduction histidine kinase